MSERVLTCVYCGHEYPQDTPTWGADVLTTHIQQCDKHPMRAVVQQRDAFGRALIAMVGESNPVALRRMAAEIRAFPASDADVGIMLNAVDALLAAPAEVLAALSQAPDSQSRHALHSLPQPPESRP